MRSMRVYGFEVEYAVSWLPLGNSRELNQDEVVEALFSRVTEWGGGTDIFLPNGGRLYIDTGAHPEYATGECLSIQDLITHDRAGDMFMRQLGKVAEERLRQRDIVGRMHILRNNTDDKGNSWGCHENLMVRRNVDLNKMINALAPFMATRPVWAGAGGLVGNDDGSVGYQFSPRIQFIEEVAGTSTSSARPLVNLRDESHAGPEYRRLHLLSGDTNQSEVVNFVKMGISGAILTMLERNRRLPDLQIDSVAFMHAIASDFSLRVKVRIPTGALLNALDIQEMYCEALEAEAERGLFDDEIAKAVRMWRAILDGLRRRDWAFLETRLDWVRKRMLIDTLVESKKVPRNDPRVRYLDFIYHDISEHTPGYELLHKVHPAVMLTTPAAVKRAMSVPPPGRATARGRFVGEVLKNRRSALIDWERWGYEDEDTMWEVLDPTHEEAGEPVMKTEALWESKSAVRAHGSRRLRRS